MDIIEDDESFINGIYGLDNLGNTCYLNSIIQTLANINLFRNFLLDQKFLDFILHKIDLIKDDNLKFKMITLDNYSIFQFYRIIKTIWTGSVDSETLKPITLIKKISMKNSMFKNNEQQDVQEAFTILVEMMHLEIAQNVITTEINMSDHLQKACYNFWAKEYSPLYEIFHGMYLTSRTCSKCNYLAREFNPNLFLSVDIPTSTKLTFDKTNFDPSIYIDINCKIPTIKINSSVKQNMCKNLDSQTLDLITDKHILISNYSAKYNLEDCLEDFISDKNIDDSICPNCHNNCECSSKNELVIPPKVLCIHIKRFGNNLIKRTNHIIFPLDLDIKNLIKNNELNLKTKYNLKSVINHSGSNLNYGHYYTYAYSSIHEKWYNFNDDNVIEINESEICTQNAYLLFYELI